MNVCHSKMLIYIEDAPLADQVAGTGLSKALVPMLKGISSSASLVAICQTHEFKQSSQHANLGSVRSFSTSYFHFVLAKLYSKLALRPACASAALHAICVAMAIKRRSRHIHFDRLWAAVGTDPLSLVRVAMIARILNIPYELFLVDDIEAHPMNRMRSLSRLLGRILNRAARLYAITAGLRQILLQRFGVQSILLPLVADAVLSTHRPTESRNYFAAYLGSVNHLYAEGLQLLISSVLELRQKTREHLLVRVCAPQHEVAQITGNQIPDWVVTGRASSQTEVGQILFGSTFAFLPYSFNSESKAMVATSFPSKLLDYLAYANAIVVYAPRWSTSAQYFLDEGLPYVVDNSEALLTVFEDLLRAKPNFSSHYREVLLKRHSPEAAIQAICL